MRSSTLTQSSTNTNTYLRRDLDALSRREGILKRQWIIRGIADKVAEKVLLKKKQLAWKAVERGVETIGKGHCISKRRCIPLEDHKDYLACCRARPAWSCKTIAKCTASIFEYLGTEETQGITMKRYGNLFKRRETSCIVLWSF